MKLNKTEYRRLKEMIQSKDEETATLGRMVLSKCQKSSAVIYILLLWAFEMEAEDNRKHTAVGYWRKDCPNIYDYMVRIIGVNRYHGSSPVFARAYELALKTSKEKAQFVLDEMSFIFRKHVVASLKEHFDFTTINMNFTVRDD